MININLEDLPIDITVHIKEFRLFLISCWSHLNAIMENHDWDEDVNFISDWLDINWEMLVEREILGDKGVLTPLSVPLLDDFLESKQEKFTVEACLSSYGLKNNVKYNFPAKSSLRLFGFCTNSDYGGFGIYPPFDFADLVIDENKEIITIPFAFLDFYLVKFSKGNQDEG